MDGEDPALAAKEKLAVDVKPAKKAGKAGVEATTKVAKRAIPKKEVVEKVPKGKAAAKPSKTDAGGAEGGVAGVVTGVKPAPAKAKAKAKAVGVRRSKLPQDVQMEMATLQVCCSSLVAPLCCCRCVAPPLPLPPAVPPEHSPGSRSSRPASSHGECPRKASTNCAPGTGTGVRIERC
jgi:hypothetical protein